MQLYHCAEAGLSVLQMRSGLLPASSASARLINSDVLEDMVRVAFTSVVPTSALLVAIIVSCNVSNIPCEMYVVCPAVSGNFDLSFTELDVNLNSSSPLLNLGCDS